MESPVVLDKPPEYHGNTERGFPFEDEEGNGAWSDLAARHPDIAARLRQRPATWARKRRPNSQDGTEDFEDRFGGFDSFPFDDIPSEFRDHFPTHWNRRQSHREEPEQSNPPPQQPQQHQPQQQQPKQQQPQQQTVETQTEEEPQPETSKQTLPQYGLRNTVDLGQKSPLDPSLVDAEERSPRAMSAPPDAPPEQPSNVRHIPIFVEGRDEPVINKSKESQGHPTHYAETKPQHPPQQPTEREYYPEEASGFHHAPNFARAFGTPFNKGYRQGPQPFVQQKAYPQSAFTRGASPARSQSPKPHPEEHFVKVPVHHETAPRPEPKMQQRPQQQQHQTQHQPEHQEQAPQPPKPQPPSPNDPIPFILSIQTDVLNLMSEVENFTGTKKDKQYIYLDEMLTRNLIKLDNVETDGKENIRQARKEAIRCIQKCIAVLEAKADARSANAAPVQDAEMKETQNNGQQTETGNGEIVMKEVTKDENIVHNAQSSDAPNLADTRLETNENVDIKKPSPKKGGKIVKKRDKGKDNETKDSNKDQVADKKVDVINEDIKADKVPQAMEVDATASQ